MWPCDVFSGRRNRFRGQNEFACAFQHSCLDEVLSSCIIFSRRKRLRDAPQICLQVFNIYSARKPRRKDMFSSFQQSFSEANRARMICFQISSIHPWENKSRGKNVFISFQPPSMFSESKSRYFVLSSSHIFGEIIARKICFETSTFYSWMKSRTKAPRCALCLGLITMFCSHIRMSCLMLEM